MRHLIALSLGWLLYSCGEPQPAFQETAALADDANVEVGVSSEPTEPEIIPENSVTTTNPEEIPEEVRNQLFPNDPGDVPPTVVASTPPASDPGNTDNGNDNDGNTDSDVAVDPTPPGTEPGLNIPPVNDDDNGVPPGDEGPPEFSLYTQNSVQKGNSKVDILWIIDNSGSMKEEQDYLGANFISFINGLSLTGIDFQTAITNTDVCDEILPAALEDRSCPFYYGGSSATHLRGSFIGPVLSAATPNLTTEFKNQTALGTNGSSFEHGLKATQLAISKVLSGDNENLLRDESFLSVIVVSDEEDDGIGLGMTDAYNLFNFVEEGLTSFSYTPDNLINYLETNKGAGNFSVSAITGTRLADGTMCSAPHSQPLEEGTAYIDIASKTGGSLQSICDTDWGISLFQLGQDLNAQATQILLDRQPIVSSIKVSVDGVDNTNWTYFPTINTIKFDANSLPAVGSDIQVEYMAPTVVD